jgi:hypothetical protein
VDGVERMLCVLRTGKKVRVLRKQLLEAGAPFTPWDSLSSLFIATSKSPDETLKEGRPWLDLVLVC